MRIGLKSPITQLGSSKESLASRVKQVGGRTSGLGDEVEDLDQIINDYNKFTKPQERKIQEMWDSMERLSLLIIDVGERKES